MSHIQPYSTLPLLSSHSKPPSHLPGICNDFLTGLFASASTLTLFSTNQLE